jgi:predicted nuclease with TOPRIM domain
LTDELRQLIQKQMKQKELLECELIKEREKLEMVRFDIITLSSPMMTRDELQQLCDEISRLRSACDRLAYEIDVVTARKFNFWDFFSETDGFFC